MKVLVWHQKNGDALYDASTPEKQDQAFLKMFNEADAQGDYECCPPEGRQVPLYEKAKAGDAKAAASFIGARKDYEYEGYEFNVVKL